ncbi:MAG: hypothetical protein JSR60_10840 [Proteobacteria bacterium]|nr:hypothetical protein [Pseudomonadota bacterium]
MALGGLGAGAILLGFVWIGRGTEWFVWPADSFMAGETMWAWRGLALIAMGGAMVWGARRF